MKKNYIYISIIYLSVVFVIMFLLRNDYVKFSSIKLNFSFLISVLAFISGFVVNSYLLHSICRSHNITVSVRTCLSAFGKTIFSKYIPGKVALIYAIAYNIREKNSTPLSAITYCLILFQILSIIGAFITGVFFIFPLSDISVVWKIATPVLIVASILIFKTGFVFGYFKKLVNSKLKNDIEIKSLTTEEIIRFLFTAVLFWLLWGTGIYYFIASLDYQIQNQHLLIFLFPLSISLGILSFITPSGLGVREGVLAALIVSIGNDFAVAADISILSRLWFLICEFIIFSSSYAISFLSGINSQHKTDHDP